MLNCGPDDNIKTGLPSEQMLHIHLEKRLAMRELILSHQVQW